MRTHKKDKKGRSLKKRIRRANHGRKPTNEKDFSQVKRAHSLAKEFSLRPKNSNKLISKQKGVEYTWIGEREIEKVKKVFYKNLLFLKGMALVKSPTWVSH